MKKQILAALLSGLFVVGCTKSGDEIRVGEFGSLTGNEATFGISTNKGIRMAIDEVNEKGGIKGKKIKLITLDDQGKDTEAVQVVTRLITQEKVVAVLGEVASSRTKAAAPIAQEYKIPLITPSSTNPEVTKIGDHVFRVCFIDPFQGYVMAKFASENLKLKKVAILRDVKNDYSVGLADVFAADFKKMGGEITSDISYQAGDVDFKAQLTQIRSKNPDAIYVPGYYTEVGLIAKQARDLGIKAPLMGGDGWDSSKLSEIGKDAINGSYFSNHYTSESTDPVVQDFIKRFKDKYGETPDGLAAMGYDAAKVLITAMERAPDLNPKSIRDEIAKTKDFVGVTGKITLNENRDAVKSAVIVQVQGATNKYVTTINPTP
ncbi:MAG: ABC transporter substrate-binding protein [Bdellovibrionaceae bacterium]|nr:ABC transporter substrate-binding protein [Pseudobdellovibrionaceae bacterium]MBX3033068.1 ABC transporter substrate-binding protein [Pseudobdellovibrionaceae bacterium]